MAISPAGSRSRAARAPSPWRALSRSRRRRRPSAISPPAIISGTAASSCSRPPCISASWSGCGPTCSPPARQPSNRPKPMPISSASTRRRSPTAQPTPSTTRSWSIRARPRSYRSIHNGSRVQVKHITVKPGAKLSLQMHHHRAEHWVVVQGTAKVVRGNEEVVLTEDQSTYIPLGAMHRLENIGKIPLHVIEVQSGSYLGEDDIVRFDDHYGRK